MTNEPAPGRSIRFRLGLAVALALSPVLILGALQSYSEFQRDAATRGARLVDAAQHGTAGARGRIQAAVTLIQALSPQSTGAGCAPLLSNLVSTQKGYENAARFDASGAVSCSAKPVQDEPARAQADWFKRLASGDRLVMERAPAGVYGPDAGVLAATPIRDAQGHFDGALAVVLKLDDLKPDLSDTSLPAGAEVAIADEHGRIIVATRPEAFANVTDAMVAGAVAKGGIKFDGKDGQGDLRTEAVAPLVEDDAFVVLSAPKQGIAGFARLNPYATIVFPLLAWILAWATVWVAADQVVIRWLAYLDRIASFYAKGRFSVRPVQAESAPAEIRSLAHTLDTMAEAIVARDLSLRDSIAHKDALMREIHHRVKNNLQVITSLLNMQQRSLTDPAARMAMSDTRQRITALALIYRALYQSPDLSRVDVRQFLEELIAQLVTGEGGRPSNIRTELEADDLEIDPDKLAPLALFAVEAITNARKHAFDGEGAVIRVRFAVEPENVVLEISDDGREAKEGEEPGVGRTLMAAFARQLRGHADFSAEPAGGSMVRLVFPRPEASPTPPGTENSGDAQNRPPQGSPGNQAAA